MQEFSQDNYENYEEGDAYEPYQPKARSSGKKVVLAAASLAAIVTIAFVGLGIKSQKSTQVTNNYQAEEELPSEMLPDTVDHIPTTAEKSAPQLESGHVPAQNASSTPKSTGTISVQKISWEIPDYLSYSNVFREYLSNIGRSVKLALSSDLLFASDYVYNKQVRVDVGIDKMGNIKEVKLAKGTGSTQIDDIVLQSVKSVLNASKPPSDEIKGLGARMSIIINL
jgi:hypothetical protein